MVYTGFGLLVIAIGAAGFTLTPGDDQVPALLSADARANNSAARYTCGSYNANDCSAEYRNALQNPGGLQNFYARCAREWSFRGRCKLCCGQAPTSPPTPSPTPAPTLSPCTQPIDTQGYQINSQSSLSVSSFQVSVACAEGFAGNALASCSGGGPYVLSGCEDLDECSLGTDTCGASNVVCTNEEGSFSCACAQGFRESDRGVCADEDECALGLHECSSNHASCRNNIGGYDCECERLYADAGDGRSCVLNEACEDARVVVLLDSSDSVRSVWESHTKPVALQFASALFDSSVGSTLTFVNFGSGVAVSPQVVDVSSAQAVLSAMKRRRGRTDVSKALQEAASLLQNMSSEAGAELALVMLSDGEFKSGSIDVASVSAIRDLGVSTWAINIRPAESVNDNVSSYLEFGFRIDGGAQRSVGGQLRQLGKGSSASGCGCKEYRNGATSRSTSLCIKMEAGKAICTPPNENDGMCPSDHRICNASPLEEGAPTYGTQCGCHGYKNGAVATDSVLCKKVEQVSGQTYCGPPNDIDGLCPSDHSACGKTPTPKSAALPASSLGGACGCDTFRNQASSQDRTLCLKREGRTKVCVPPNAGDNKCAGDYRTCVLGLDELMGSSNVLNLGSKDSRTVGSAEAQLSANVGASVLSGALPGMTSCMALTGADAIDL